VEDLEDAELEEVVVVVVEEEVLVDEEEVLVDVVPKILAHQNL
jgi:hypothetical protein